MKNLASKKMKTLLVIGLIFSFLISSFFQVKNKKDAQSNFCENTLSFLLPRETSADFISTLEQFNKTSKIYKLVYINENKDIYYNPEKLNMGRIVNNFEAKKEESPYQKLKTNQGFLTYRLTYIGKNEGILGITRVYNLSFYFSLPIFLCFLFLGFVMFIYIDDTIDSDIDNYFEALKIYNIRKNIDDKKYMDLVDIFNPYIQRIDDLKEEKSSLYERLTGFISITSNMKEGFILFDDLGNIELINDSAKKYLSVDKNVKLYDLIDDREYVLALKESLILKRSKYLDIKINGYYLRIYIDPLISARKKSISMIIVDNSKDKIAEQMRREFSANVSHELKSPLTSINGYAELIGNGLAKDEDISKFANIIYEEGNRLLQIIDDILKISKLDEEDFDKDYKEVDISKVVTATIEKFKSISNKKNIEITNNIDSFRILTSKYLFYDLVSNIYENAIKYNKFAGKIIVDYKLEENHYDLIIEDTGIGIEEADTERIFERFFVVDKSRKRNQKSTGLGLSIVKHICLHLGYQMRIKSQINKGSKFIIEIPLKKDK